MMDRVWAAGGEMLDADEALEPLWESHLVVDERIGLVLLKGGWKLCRKITSCMEKLAFDQVHGRSLVNQSFEYTKVNMNF